jgi:hypothetical protein
MRLNPHDKAHLNRYRRNLYGLCKLHMQPTDIEDSKRRFVEHCREQYPEHKDQIIDYESRIRTDR